MPNQRLVARNLVLSAAIAAALVRPGISSAQNAPAAAGDDTLDAVIVSGTRIPQQDLNTPTPVVSIGAEAIELSGTTNITDFLTNQPALTGSTDAAQTSGSAGFIGSAGLNLLNLRNLGTQRTLVLIDGRRHVGQLPDTASVDVNTIPTDLIDRIDIVTGGVSAVYGADGVSGVVNFVMKKDFEGFTARLQYGVADENEKPENWLGAMTGGFNFADDRGNFAASLEHRNEGHLRATDRAQYSRQNYTTLQENPDDAADDPNVPDFLPFRDVRFFDSSRAGGIDLDFDGVPDINPDGSTYQIPLFLTPFYSVGGSGTHRADYIGDLLAHTATTIGSAFFNFEVNESVSVFAEAKYVYGEAYTESQPTFDFFLFIEPDNPLIPAVVRSQIIPGIDALLISRDNFDFGTRADDVTRRTFRSVAGIKGNLFADFDYEVSYVYGDTRVDNVSVNNRYNDRFLAALDVVAGPGGVPTCRSNLTPSALPFQPFQGFDFGAFGPGELSFTPGPNSGCVPLNLFGEGVPSQAALDWINVDSVTKSRLTQNVATAFAQGAIPGFELPGGPIQAVIGAEWRRETSKGEPPLEDQAGLTFGNIILPSYGEFDVKEGFLELQAPILKEVTAFELLQLNTAIRVSDYSTVGSTTTYNYGATWRPLKDIGIRAMRAVSVRAPNISELFSPSSQTFLFVSDPCDQTELNNGSSFRAANCAALGITQPFTDPNSASIGGIARGNAALIEETADSYIYGIVLTPRFAPGLAIAVDYYDIKIEDAISTATAQEVADNCVDQPTINNVFCSAITRDPADFRIDGFTVQPENVAQFRTRGIDFNVSYNWKPEMDIGQFKFDLVGNFLERLTRIPTPGAEQVDDRGLIRAPKKQFAFDATWKIGGFAMTYGLNWFDQTQRFDYEQLRGDPDTAAPEFIYYAERKTHDVSMAYDISDHSRIYAGVNNLNDQKPDLSTLYPVSAVGRFFFAGLRVGL